MQFTNISNRKLFLHNLVLGSYITVSQALPTPFHRPRCVYCYPSSCTNSYAQSFFHFQDIDFADFLCRCRFSAVRVKRTFNSINFTGPRMPVWKASGVVVRVLHSRSQDRGFNSWTSKPQCFAYLSKTLHFTVAPLCTAVNELPCNERAGVPFKGERCDLVHSFTMKTG